MMSQLDMAMFKAFEAKMQAPSKQMTIADAIAQISDLETKGGSIELRMTGILKALLASERARVADRVIRFSMQADSAAKQFRINGKDDTRYLIRAQVMREIAGDIGGMS